MHGHPAINLRVAWLGSGICAYRPNLSARFGAKCRHIHPHPHPHHLPLLFTTMPTSIRIALAQTCPLNAPSPLPRPTTGSPSILAPFEKNLEKAAEWIVKASKEGAEVVVFPEYFLQGIVDGREVSPLVWASVGSALTNDIQRAVHGSSGSTRYGCPVLTR